MALWLSFPIQHAQTSFHVSCEGKTPSKFLFLHSKEGVTQGSVLTMVLYAMLIIQLIKLLKNHFQKWHPCGMPMTEMLRVNLLKQEISSIN